MAQARPSRTLTTENPNEENIKCVVVGDNNVGKTRLVFSRAYKQYAPNHQYLQYGGTHIPTVWANDHYRNDPKVLRNAHDNIDGVDVSLRLWDTFGDHGKNRKFSYGRADVVIACFSVCDRRSLEHLKTFWLPEIRRHCKRVPVVIVACKVDLRFADLDQLNEKKVSLAKRIKAEDILYPEICRQTASEVGCLYYESSICKGFGVKEVFENVIRTALVYRRSMYLYRNIHLRHVQKPLLQAPLMPPKPCPPKLPEVETETPLNFSCLFENSSCSDLLIIGSNFKFHAHKVILASASKAFHQVFRIQSKPFHLIPLHSDESSPIEDDIIDGVVPLKSSALLEDCHGNEIITEKKEQPFSDFFQMYECNHDDPYCTQDVLTLTTDISESAFLNIMHFLYTGCLNPEIANASYLKANIQYYSDLLAVGKKFGLNDFLDLLKLTVNEEPGKHQTMKHFDNSRKNMLKNTVLWKNEYADIVFEADDGAVPGHKAVLVSGSDMMNAMFGSDFIESGIKIVPFPETTVESLQIVFEYIYTKNISSIGNSSDSYGNIIALANRLCLPDLISIIEVRIIKEFEQKASVSVTRDLHENVIIALEIAQFHNAHNLAEWCVYYIASNYNDVCKKCKILKSLAPENLQRLERCRWPPVWFIKDYDAYERAYKKRLIEENDSRGKNSKKSRSLVDMS